MIDEDYVRDLMAGFAADIAAPAGVAARVSTRQRRRDRRVLMAKAGVTSVTVGTTLGLVATGGGSGGPRTTSPLRLTATQQTLRAFAASAAAAPAPAGRYAVLVEDTSDGRRTSVIDGETGDVTTYQRAAHGAPSELPVARHGSPTAAELAAVPTDPAGLRAYLLGLGRRHAADARKLRAVEDQLLRQVGARTPPPVPQPTADDVVVAEAADSLWNPLTPPALRAALFQLLAATPGVRVTRGATDSAGRAAVEVSRTDSATGQVVRTFEDPATSRTLETSWDTRDDRTGAGELDRDTYLSITRTDAVPADPYR